MCLAISCQTRESPEQLIWQVRGPAKEWFEPGFETIEPNLDVPFKRMQCLDVRLLVGVPVNSTPPRALF